jgi:succinate-semialdehyde dehydrogenase/glutarate-semialdehyde dehydrogenase
MTYQSRNPATGVVLQTYDALTDLDLELKIETAAKCFESWRHTSFAARAAIMDKAAALVHARSEMLAQTMTSEMGKRISEARGETAFSAAILTYYARNAERFLAPATLHPDIGEAHMESSPIGAIFCVEPWNFPYYQLARVAGPQLMAGNVIMVKHAGCVPQCAAAFAQIWIDAGAPPGLYTDLRISHDQANRVIDDPRIKGVALTGSVSAGRAIAARAGQNLKPSSMELGGSDPFIVLDDKDLDRTVRWAVWGRIYNDGQTCCGAKRFIVLDSVADRFLEKFAAAFAALKPGDPQDPATTLGPLSSEEALLQILDQVRKAVAAGATLVMGGSRIDRPGFYMQPTILTDIAQDNPAFRDEFFGPVAMLFRVKNEDSAVALANDSDFGLGGAVFTADVAQGRRVASRVETGMMFINNLSWSDAELPFGGIKNSGYGRELGDMGIQAFVNKKLVRIAALDAPV